MRPTLRPSASYPRLNAGFRVGKAISSSPLPPQTLVRRYHHLQSALEESRMAADTLREELSKEAACLQESLCQLAPVMSEQEERLRELQWKLEMTERDKHALARKVQVAEGHLKKTVVELEVAREETEEARRRHTLSQPQGLPFGMSGFSALSRELFIPPPRTSSIPQEYLTPEPPHRLSSLPPSPLRGVVGLEKEETRRASLREGSIFEKEEEEEDMNMEDMEDMDDVDHWAGLGSDDEEYGEDEDYEDYDEEDDYAHEEEVEDEDLDGYNDYSTAAPPVAIFG
ncbi:hypothetical protein BJ684DRAFT_20820 [Piptocephalis cylindrospora]|uniref:Uncharacterized protein n=1 Tax=Piptocephalis cylindrospora TaxID=1907219 RepID=A0A4P9Y1J8_9FUNG|nr:hypothetical protein BJ684DRAFT_20820 [Piptocephalis cylindrospora]|eukprot:RKP12655.1 hypothetical protein BJ684DRAFT_20820 [Piptocephalis cylindrospora]